MADTLSALPAEVFLTTSGAGIQSRICSHDLLGCKACHASKAYMPGSYMNKPAMPLDSRLCRDKSLMDLDPETLGLKGTQLLALQETGGPRSNPQIQAFLPNSASAPSFVITGS